MELKVNLYCLYTFTLFLSTICFVEEDLPSNKNTVWDKTAGENNNRYSTPRYIELLFCMKSSLMPLNYFRNLCRDPKCLEELNICKPINVVPTSSSDSDDEDPTQTENKENILKHNANSKRNKRSIKDSSAAISRNDFIRDILRENYSNMDLSDKRHEPTKTEVLPWLLLTGILPKSKEEQKEIKKSPSFNAWGGKRNIFLSKYLKRYNFNSWGGKRTAPDDLLSDRIKSYMMLMSYLKTAGRNSDLTEYDNNMQQAKRQAFNSWGGKKRSNSNTELFAPVKNLNDYLFKRNEFNAWGGKRSIKGYSDDCNDSAYNSVVLKRDDLEQSKALFEPWGGKRFSKLFPFLDNSPASKKNADSSSSTTLRRNNRETSGSEFFSWGGKRNIENGSYKDNLPLKKPEFEQIITLPKNQNTNTLYRKRSAPSFLAETEDMDLNRVPFGAWGGKRKENVDYINNIPKSNDAPKREAVFNSWGGKRANFLEDKRSRFNSWGGKRLNINPDFGDIHKKAQFNSWGGKRTHSLLDNSNSEAKREFKPWGGKRYLALDTNTGELNWNDYDYWDGNILLDNSISNLS